MPDPSSFMVGNAPQGASYAAPLVGFQIGDHSSPFISTIPSSGTDHGPRCATPSMSGSLRDWLKANPRMRPMRLPGINAIDRMPPDW
jgi:hypothetical protein